METLVCLETLEMVRRDEGAHEVVLGVGPVVAKREVVEMREGMRMREEVVLKGVVHIRRR